MPTRSNLLRGAAAFVLALGLFALDPLDAAAGRPDPCRDQEVEECEPEDEPSTTTTTTTTTTTEPPVVDDQATTTTTTTTVPAAPTTTAAPRAAGAGVSVTG